MVAEKTAPEENGSVTPPREPPTPPAAPAEEPAVPSARVRMRQKTPITAQKGDRTTALPVGNPAAALQRTMEALYEAPPEMEDNNEEIRKLDSQLDHLNDYMDKVEARLRSHNDKLTAMLKEQREEREKRRQSFHERMAQTKQEDVDFQQQLAALLNRVDVSRRRSVIDHGHDS